MGVVRRWEGCSLLIINFVGVSGSLQKLISVVHGWRLKANVCKSAVMVFSRNPVEGEWKCGEHALPRISNYTYLGIDFACNGAWDVHICRKKVQQGYKFDCAASSAAFYS